MRGARRGCPSLLSLGGRAGRPSRPAEMELPQIPDRPRRRLHRLVLDQDHTHRPQADARHRRGTAGEPMSDYSDILRLALALALGGAIGFERRWHGHAAGPHTNALVAFAAALFVMIGFDLDVA